VLIIGVIDMLVSNNLMFAEILEDHIAWLGNTGLEIKTST